MYIRASRHQNFAKKREVLALVPLFGMTPRRFAASLAVPLISGVEDGGDHDGSHHPTGSAIKREDNINRSPAWGVDRAIVFASGSLWVRSLDEMPQSF
jgi:hypothetical protein